MRLILLCSLGVAFFMALFMIARHALTCEICAHGECDDWLPPSAGRTTNAAPRPTSESAQGQQPSAARAEDT